MNLLTFKWDVLQVEDAKIYCRPHLGAAMEREAEIFAAYRQAQDPPLAEDANIPAVDYPRVQAEAFLAGGSVGGWEGFSEGDAHLASVAPGTLGPEHHADGIKILSHPDILRLVRQRCQALTVAYYRLQEDATGN